MQDAFARAGLQVFERGWLSSNNVLFARTGDAESVLVDSGYCSHASQTVALVAHAIAGRSLTRIVNTHLHSDHCGGNAALQAAFSCDIDVPDGEAAKVDAWDESALTYRATGQHCPRFRRTGVVRAGQVLVLAGRSWQTIASPGHDPESFVLHEPELGILISADALWANGLGVIFPELEGQGAFGAARATLERLAGLHVRWVIPGHGAPFDDFADAVQRALRRIDGFIADPHKHAKHAAKVLIKFRLLEVGRMSAGELDDWLRATRYLQLVHAVHGTGRLESWCHGLIDEMCSSGAVQRDGDRLLNI